MGSKGTWLRKDLNLYGKGSCLSLGPPPAQHLTQDLALAAGRVLHHKIMQPPQGERHRAMLEELVRSIKNKQEKRKKSVKTAPPRLPPSPADALCSLSISFHQHPGDLTVNEAQRNASKQEASAHISCFCSISPDRRGMPLKPKSPEKAVLGKLRGYYVVELEDRR